MPFLTPKRPEPKNERMIKMTGEEFLNWLHGVKKIEKVEWVVSGDALDADEVSVLITADGKRLSIPFGCPKWVKYPDDFHTTLFCLIANKVTNQPSFNISNNPADVVNATRKALDPEGR